MIQIAGKSEAIEAIRLIASGVDIRQIQYQCELKMLHNTIIYDNSCKLYQYVPNCQPSHFQNTNFFVDLFHWRGHVGCSSGYSLDKYTTSDIATINSQVNEQANAGLQRIKGQIAYMKPENFMFHVKMILSIMTMDKKR